MNRRDRSTLRVVSPNVVERAPADLTAAAVMLDAIRRGDDLKPDKVGRLRSAIETHSYENALKLSVALDRLMDKLETA